jgi:hypothetical protein
VLRHLASGYRSILDFTQTLKKTFKKMFFCKNSLKIFVLYLISILGWYNKTFIVIVMRWTSKLSVTRDKGNMLHCTGCRNTQVLFKLTEILWDRQFCRMSQDVGKLRCGITQVPYLTCPWENRPHLVFIAVYVLQIKIWFEIVL